MATRNKEHRKFNDFFKSLERGDIFVVNEGRESLSTFIWVKRVEKYKRVFAGEHLEISASVYIISAEEYGETCWLPYYYFSTKWDKIIGKI